MKTLIAGGLGYIRFYIAFLLKEKAIIIDNHLNSHLNYKNLQRIFFKHSITGVIHLAGLKSFNESIKLSLHYFRNNVYSTLELLECMDKFKISKFFFLIQPRSMVIYTHLL